jgi:hypothetical protein
MVAWKPLSQSQAEHGHGSWLLRTRRLLHAAATCLRSSSSVCSCQATFRRTCVGRAAGCPNLARDTSNLRSTLLQPTGFVPNPAAIFWHIPSGAGAAKCAVRRRGTFYSAAGRNFAAGSCLFGSPGVRRRAAPAIRLGHAPRRGAITACSNVLRGNHTSYSYGQAKIACAF